MYNFFNVILGKENITAIVTKKQSLDKRLKFMDIGTQVL